MARDVTVLFAAAAASSSCRPVFLYQGDFTLTSMAGFLRLWTGTGDLSYGGSTYLGNGWFLGKDGGEEVDTVEAVSMSILLSGVPSTVIETVLGQQRQGAPGQLYFGFISDSGTLMADPYLAWEGKYSHSEIVNAADRPIVRVVYETDMIDVQRPNELRWTHETQQIFFPGDTGFQYVKAAANFSGSWGGEKKKQGKDNKKKDPKPRGPR